MRQFRIGLSLVAVVAVVTLMVMPSAAHATALAINIYQTSGTYYNGGAGLTYYDGGTFDQSGSLNTLTVSTDASSNPIPALVGLSLTLDTAFTNRPGDASGAYLDLNWSVHNAGSVTGVVYITASVDGFTTPPAGAHGGLISNLSGNIGGTGTVTGQQWLNPDNSMFGTTGYTPGVQNLPSVQTVSFVVGTGPYSLTDRVNVSLGANSLTTGDFLSSTNIPEPTSLLLFGTGLLGISVIGRRLRKR